MADLDDFFAKKDRKKSKSKKFSTTEEVAKKLEEPKKNEKQVKKDRLQEGEEGGDSVQEQDEWKDFEEEKKDYSGLKIGNLTINPNTEGNIDGTESNNEQQPRYDESGNAVEKKVGPWNKIEVEAAQPEKVEKKTEAPVPTSGGGAGREVYVPPSLRNISTIQTRNSKANNAALDLNNEAFFPSLSGSKSDKKNRNEGAFEVVSHNKSSSYRHAEQSKLPSSQGPKLTLGNSYNALSNDS